MKDLRGLKDLTIQDRTSHPVAAPRCSHRARTRYETRNHLDEYASDQPPCHPSGIGLQGYLAHKKSRGPAAGGGQGVTPRASAPLMDPAISPKSP